MIPIKYKITRITSGIIFEECYMTLVMVCSQVYAIMRFAYSLYSFRSICLILRRFTSHTVKFDIKIVTTLKDSVNHLPETVMKCQ